jgi:LacI family transcriptional regulator
LTKHLIEHGHKNIACITGPTSESSSRERLEGYKKSLIENGLTINNDLVKISNWQISGGFESTIEIVKNNLNKVSAIFYANALMALGAYRALRQCNLRVPEDIALVSFDNLEIAENVAPAITTLDEVNDKIGELAFEILYEKVLNKSKRENILETVVEAELCIRESCGCKKK